MIRGADPQPGANTTFNGKKLSLYNASISTTEQENAGTGRVIAISGSEITISTGDGSIKVGRVRAAGGKKISAADWSESAGLKIGDIFGS